MPDGKATVAKRTRKKAIAVAEAATTTKSTTSKKTVSNTSADVVPVPAVVVSKAHSASKARTTRPIVKTADVAAKLIEPKKVTSGLKSPGPASVRLEGLGKANGASAPAKVIGKVNPARNAATTKPKVEVTQPTLAAGKLIGKPAEPSKEERQRWIATAAYHRAEKRGFAPGYEVQDWLDAEAEVNELIGQARSK
jgi:hypothetical protein